MKVGIFDLETTSFYADSGIVLCCVSQPYVPDEITKAKQTVIRADQFKSWKTNKSDNKALIEAVVTELKKYDILVAHNGQFFDKGFINAKCLQYGLSPSVRWLKFIDPVLLSRRHLKLGRNSLASLIDFLEIPVHKTPLELKLWQKAAMDSDPKAMNVIVRHCEYDVRTLALVYDKVRVLVDKIDNQGSSR